MKTLFALLFAMMIIPGVVDAQYILTMNLDQMDAYIGKSFTVFIAETETGREVGRKTISEIETAQFSIALYSLLQGRNYNIDFTVDVNENGECDTPPADHAWRRTITNASQHTTINFSPDDVFTSISCPADFPYSQYDAVWGGKWHNLTFGSTDSIEASFTTTCDSVFGFFMTAGVFGNPQPVIFNYAEERPNDGGPFDTVTFTPGAPWTGEVNVIEDRIEGDISMSGFQFVFTGTVGATQILCLYEVYMNGNLLANGYFHMRELEILSSTPELELTGAFSNVSCGGANDGEIFAISSGGTGNHTYSWSNGSTSSVISNLSAGEYCVTLTDSDGCRVVRCFLITEPPALIANGFNVDAGCFGFCDGYAQVTVTGGQLPYTYAWSSGSDSTSAADLCAGVHSVTVTDEVGCTAVFETVIEQPDTILIDTLGIIHASDGQANGVLSVIVSGGAPPFLYSLEGSAYQASFIFAQLPAGQYCVFVIDNNGCEAKSAFYEILNLTGIEELQTQFRLYPNPASSEVHVESDAAVSISMYDVNGQNVKSSTTSITHTINIDYLMPGIYFLEIADHSGRAYRKIIVQ